MAARRTFVTGRKTAYLAMAALFVATQSASADNFQWALAGAGAWNTATANWNNLTTATNGVVWVNNAATPNDAIFDNASAGTVTLSATHNVNSLSFLTGGWTLTGGAITGGSGGQLLTVNTGTAISNTIASPIFNNGGTSVLFTGAGDVLLSGNSIYQGGTTIDAGTTVRVGVVRQALPGTTNLIVNAGGTAGGVLNLNGFTQWIAGLSGTAGTVKGAVTNTSTNVGNLFINSNTNQTVSNVDLTGATLGVRKIGSGTLTLTEAYTFGGLTPTTGQLVVQNYVTPAGGVTPVTSGNVAGFFPAGTVELATTSSVVNAGIVVGALGQLVVNTNNTVATNRSAGVYLTNGGVFTLKGTDGLSTLDNFGTLTIGNVTNNVGVGSGQAKLIVLPGVGGTSTLNFTTLTRSVGTQALINGGTGQDGTATVVFSGPGLGLAGGASHIKFTTTPTLTTTGGGVGVLKYALVDQTPGGPGTAFATYDATEGIRGLAAGDYNATTNPTTLAGTTNGHLLYGASTTTTLTTATANTITIQGAGVTIDGTGTLTLGSGVLSTGSAANIINGPSLAFGSGVEAVFHAVQDLTINSTITQGGTNGQFTIDGPGTLTLAPSSANTIAGKIRINSGTLVISSNNALAGASAGVIVVQGGALRVTGDVTHTPGITFGPTSAITGTEASGYVLDVTGNNTFTVGNIYTGGNTSGSGFNKIGTGTFALSGVGTGGAGFSYVSGGTFAFVSATASHTGNVVLEPGTAISIDSSASVASVARIASSQASLLSASVNITTGNGSTDTFSTLAAIAGNSVITLTPSNAANSTGIFRVTGSMTRSAGSTLLFRGSQLGSVAGANVNQVTFASTPTQVNGILPYALADTDSSGTGIGFATVGANGLAVAATTAGTIGTSTSATNLLVAATDNTAGTVNSLTLNGTGISAGSGTVTVNAGGVLNMGGVNSIDATTLAFGSREAIFHALTDLTVNSNITGSGGLTKSGAGTLTLAGTSNAYTGTTWINGGVLQVSADSNLGNTATPIVINRGGTLGITEDLTSARALTINANGQTAISVAAARTATLSGNISGQSFSAGTPANGLGINQFSTLTVGGLGTLRLNGTTASNVLVSVSSGATLGGTGTLGGGITVAAGGHIAPGNSIGTLTTTNLTLTATGELDYEFGAAGGTVDHTAAGASDRISATGNTLAFPAVGNVLLNAVDISLLDTNSTGSFLLLSYTNDSAVSNFLTTSGTIGAAPATPGSIQLGNGWASLAGSTYTIVNDAVNDGIFLDITGGAVTVVNATWATNVDGNWSTAANWIGGVPSGAGSTANFTGNTLAAVNVDGPRTLGRVIFSGATDYTISGSALTLDNTGGTGTTGLISSAGGTQTVAAAIVTTASNLEVAVAAGTVKLDGAISGTGNVTLSGPGTVLMNNTNSSSGSTTINNGTLGGSGTITGNVVAGAAAHTIAPSATLASNTATALTVGGLTTNADTTMAFNLITPGPAGSSDRIKVTGTNGLTLNGGKITVSTAGGASSLGWYNIIEHEGFTGSLAGVTVPTPTSSIVYVLDGSDPDFIRLHRGYNGDANDDGTVNFSDFIILSQNFGQNGTWNQANFTGASVVDFNDFVVLSQNFGNTIAGGQLVSEEEIALFQSASQSFLAGQGIPEPTSLAMLGIGAAGLLTRRRKN
jgi:autotransporter-associated beta strand protein